MSPTTYALLPSGQVARVVRTYDPAEAEVQPLDTAGRPDGDPLFLPENVLEDVPDDVDRCPHCGHVVPLEGCDPLSTSGRACHACHDGGACQTPAYCRL